MYVVLLHVQHPDWFASVPPLHRLVASSYNGVSLFFVLSGFILAYNYQAVHDVGAFWVARFARIYPAYLLALLLTLCIAITLPPALPLRLLMRPLGTDLLLLQAWTHYAFTLNSPAWTLSAEAFFYACFPLLLRPMQRLGAAGFALLWLVWVTVCAAPVLLAASAAHAENAHAFARTLEGPLPLLRLPGFLLGVAAGNLYVRRGMPHGRATRTALLLGILGAVALLTLAPDELGRPLRTAALLTAFAALVYGLAGSRWRGWGVAWMQTAGEISYGIYILQVPVLRLCLGLQRRFAPRAEEQAVLFVPVLLLVAYLVFRFVETPARLQIRAWCTPPAHQRSPVLTSSAARAE